MQSSSSTFSSSIRLRYRNYSVAVLGSVVLTLLVSAAVLHWWPQFLYWRAWEYFDEIGNREANPEMWTWHRYEKGDHSRNFVFRYQDSWPTHVSSDADGYRSTPCVTAAGYEILLQGESHMWASGISDHETIPWRLSQLLDRPVFNGGRWPNWLGRVLAHPRLRNAKIVVEARAAHLIVPGSFDGGFELKNWDAYRIIRAEPRFARISFKRYFLPAQASRYLGFASDLWRPWSIFGAEQAHLVTEIYGPEFSTRIDGPRTQAMVGDSVTYARRVEAHGYTYIFAPMPNVRFAYNAVRDEYFSNLVKELRSRGVHAVDLHDAFWKHRGRNLYLRTDTHLTALGADLAARTIADYLRVEGLLDPLPKTSCALPDADDR
jgi:hypothetical protein